MSRPSWHRQARLEADVNAVRPDLDHEVRVDMIAWHRTGGARSSYPTDPEPWRARCAPHIIISSSRVGVSQRRSTRGSPQLRRSRRHASNRVWPHGQATPPCGQTSAGGRPWPPGPASKPRASDWRDRGISSHKTLQCETLCLTQACTVPSKKDSSVLTGSEFDG